MITLIMKKGDEDMNTKINVLKISTALLLVLCICLTGCKAKENINAGTNSGNETVESGESVTGGTSENGDTAGGTTGTFAEEGSTGGSTGGNSGSGSSGITTPDPNFLTKPEEIKVVKYAAMPTTTGTIMRNADMNTAYRPHTEWRIYSIRTTKSTIKPTGSGTAYYVSPAGKDTNNGKSPETPWKTLNKVNSYSFKSGDVVYFQCGGLWRGQVRTKSGVTYTSYGTGNKPEFRSFKENLAGASKWTATDIKNVYKYNGTVGSDVGLIIFNEGECWGFKAFIYTDGNGVKRDATTNEKFSSYKDLNKDLHFFYDGGILYLRSDNGNPGTRFNDIEISVKQNLFNVGTAKNVTIDNLCLKYTGAHGVGAGSCDGLTVTNCEFYFIGGSLQNSSVRYGNGVEIYGSATNYRVENCYFNQIYDAGITFQYGTGGSNIKMDNINIKNNVIEYATYSIEYFLGSSGVISNVNIEGNLCWYAGEGFTVQRPEQGHASHIKSWRHHKNPITSNFVIKNNLFALSATTLVETVSTGGGAKPTYTGNIYIQKSGGQLGYVTGNVLQFKSENIKDTLGDSAAKYITILN